MEMIALNKVRVRRSGGNALTFLVPKRWLIKNKLKPGDCVYGEVDPIKQVVRYHLKAEWWRKSVKVRVLKKSPEMTLSKEYATELGIDAGDEVEISMQLNGKTIELVKVEK